MVVGKKRTKMTNIRLYVDHYPIELKNSIKCLGIHLDRELSWKNHIDYLAEKLSKVCGMIYKLRPYVPLSTLRIVYYSMFHSHIQYSLLNWGRAAKSHFHKLSILQNKILRACLFFPHRYETNLLYSRFRVLNLNDMIKMEFTKFISSTAITCYQILSTTISSSSKTYITAALDKKVEMSTFKLLLALK